MKQFEEIRKPLEPVPQVNKHSCTTNTNGPTKDIMKHCDVSYMKINDWSCDTNTNIENMFIFADFLRKELKLDALEYISSIHRYFQASRDRFSLLSLFVIFKKV